MKPLEIKNKAINYRKRGYSYNMILEEVKVSKSILSLWLRDIPYKPNEEVLRRIKLNISKLILSAQKRGLKRQQTRERLRRTAEKQIKNVGIKDLWYIGTALYLAEGGKKQSEARITNADPRVIKLIVKWFVKICGVDKKDIQATVHIYPDNSGVKSINYWSRISSIPKSQFQKIQIDNRIKKSKFKKGTLPFGTLHLRVRRGTDLFYRINGWIDGILNQIPDL